MSGITKGGTGREATDVEIRGAAFADGLGTALAGIFGGLPNTSFVQNVSRIAMTGVMSRRVAIYGAFFPIVCGLIPKCGAIIHFSGFDSQASQEQSGSQVLECRNQTISISCEICNSQHLMLNKTEILSVPQNYQPNHSEHVSI